MSQEVVKSVDKGTTEHQGLVNKPISDWWITGLAGGLGLVLIGLLMLVGISEGGVEGIDKILIRILIKDPVVGIIFYFWLKSVVIDAVRIGKGEAVPFPGMVFWAHGMMALVYLMINSFLSRGLSLSASDPLPRGEQWFFEYRWGLFLILDSMASIGVYRTTLGGDLPKTLVGKLFFDLIKTMVVMGLFYGVFAVWQFSGLYGSYHP